MIFNVVGKKEYNFKMQEKLMNLVMQEQQEKIKTNRSHSQELEILMYEASYIKNKGVEQLNDKYGEHSHYELFNDNAIQLLKDHGEEVTNILGTIEYKDPTEEGFSLMLRNIRFK